MRDEAKDLQHHWATLRPILTIRNGRKYDRAIQRLNCLLGEVGTNQRHPLYGLLDTLGTLIHAYEEQHHLLPDSTGADMLRFLMAEHQPTQADLPEIGLQGVVSEVLGGRRDLNRESQCYASECIVW
jgi:HTH-type transcriptional regulator/antitoxin HigA